MSYDGLVMNGIARECNQLLSGARIDKIAQPNKNEIILQLRNQGKSHKLLISALAQEARVQLTTTAPPNPDQPPAFCMVLRKHLEGGRILSFEQQGMDRILYITISAMDEFGDIKPKRLIAEIMGKHSNLILTDPETGRITDSLKRVTESVNRYRQVLPGLSYLAPPPVHKLPLWQEDEEAIGTRLMTAGASQALDKLILSLYDGIGPLSVQELIYRAGASPVDTPERFGQRDYLRLFQAIQGLGKAIREGAYQGEILLQDGKPKDFSAIALTLYPAEQRQAFSSLNEMLDVFYRNRGAANLFHQEQKNLEQILYREQERCRKKAGLQAESILEGKEAQKWQILGQLLTANHYQIPQGEEALVPDYHDPEGAMVRIPMDPRLSPIENAQAYFRRYQKARQTAKMAQVHYDETMAELAYLDSLAFSLTTVRSPEELAEVRRELGEAGYSKQKPASKRASGGKSRLMAGKTGGGKGNKADKPKAREADPVISKIHYQGFDILYGRNNRQNDYLNMKVAKGGDLWFHAQSIPSAHVILRNPDKKDVPAEAVETAAKLCLWHSQAKSAGRAAIDYTLRQNIWKPKGAKPGMMLYEKFQTIYVTAEEEEIRLLLTAHQA